MFVALKEWASADYWEWHNRWYGILTVFHIFDQGALSDFERQKHQEEMHYYWEGMIWGLLLQVFMVGVFFHVLAGWQAGLVAAAAVGYHLMRKYEDHKKVKV